MKQKNKYFFMWILLIIACFIQLYKVNKGMGFEDEYFYISLGHRLANGDALFYDEWHIAQLMGIFVWPFVSFYRLVNGNLDGIVYFIRLIYAIIHIIVGLCFFKRFKEYGIYASVAVFIYIIFTPYNIMSISYNTMSVEFLMLFSLLMTSDNKRHIIDGIIFSCAVLNTPYLAFVYIVYFICVIILHLYKYRIKYMTLDYLKDITIGVFISVAIFVVFVLSRCSIGDILNSIKYIIEPGHSDGIAYSFARSMYHLIRYYRFMIILPIVQIIAMIFDKERKKRENIYKQVSLIICILTVFYILYINPILISLGGYDVIFVPMAICCLVYLYYDYNREILFFVIISLIQALMIAISSNVGPRAFSNPLVIASMILILLLKNNKNIFLQVGLIGLVCMSLVYFKINYGYAQDNVLSYKTKIEEGPLKGLIASEEDVRSYYNLLNDTYNLEKYDDEYIVYISNSIWQYFTDLFEYGGNSSLNHYYEKELYVNCLEEYFKVHDKKSVLVYLTNNKLGINEEDLKKLNLNKVENLACGDLYRYGGE